MREKRDEVYVSELNLHLPQQGDNKQYLQLKTQWIVASIWFRNMKGNTNRKRWKISKGRSLGPGTGVKRDGAGLLSVFRSLLGLFKFFNYIHPSFRLQIKIKGRRKRIQRRTHTQDYSTKFPPRTANIITEDDMTVSCVRRHIFFFGETQRAFS